MLSLYLSVLLAVHIVKAFIYSVGKYLLCYCLSLMEYALCTGLCKLGHGALKQ